MWVDSHCFGLIFLVRVVPSPLSLASPAPSALVSPIFFFLRLSSNSTPSGPVHRPSWLWRCPRGQDKRRPPPDHFYSQRWWIPQNPQTLTRFLDNVVSISANPPPRAARTTLGFITYHAPLPPLLLAAAAPIRDSDQRNPRHGGLGGRSYFRMTFTESYIASMKK
jgi:hypothetical protein